MKEGNMMRNVHKAIGGIVTMSAIGVMWWWIDEYYMNYYVPLERVSIKFITAYLFFLAGISILAPSASRIISILIIYTCAITVLAYLVNASPPCFVPQFFIEDPVDTIIAGVPCWMTLVCFILFTLIDSVKHMNRWIAAIGASCIVGNMLDIELLYFYIPSYSTGMSVVTGILFILLSMTKDK